MYGITVTDVPAFAGAAILLILMALVASYAPARRVVRLHPVAALRYE